MNIRRKLLALLASAALLLIPVVPASAVTCSDPDRTNGYVIVYENAHFGGGSLKMCGNDIDFTNNVFNNGVNINDKVSSWKFRAGQGLTSVQFCRNTSYGSCWGTNPYTYANGSVDVDTLPAITINDTFTSMRFNPSNP